MYVLKENSFEFVSGPPFKQTMLDNTVSSALSWKFENDCRLLSYFYFWFIALVLKFVTHMLYFANKLVTKNWNVQNEISYFMGKNKKAKKACLHFLLYQIYFVYLFTKIIWMSLVTHKAWDFSIHDLKYLKVELKFSVAKTKDVRRQTYWIKFKTVDSLQITLNISVFLKP